MTFGITAAGVTAAAAVGGLGYSIYKGQTSGGSGSGEQRNYAQELIQTLQAQKKIAPDVYKLEQQYQPKYAELATKTYLDNQQAMNQIGAANYGLYQDLQSKQRQADVGALDGAGKFAQNYLNQMGIGGITKEMSRQAEADLMLGKQLSPEEERATQQAARAAYAARGTGLSDQAALAEVLNRYQYANQREAQRRAFAAQAAQQVGVLSAAPMARYMGESGVGAAYSPAVSTYGGLFANAGPRYFNPESSYAGNLANQQYQAQMAQNAANQYGASQIGSASLGLLGNAAQMYANQQSMNQPFYGGQMPGSVPSIGVRPAGFPAA